MLMVDRKEDAVISEPKSSRIPKPFWFGIAVVPMVVLAVFLQVWLPYHEEQIAIREIERLGGESWRHCLWWPGIDAYSLPLLHRAVV